jgi:hypothetical protein
MKFKQLQVSSDSQLWPGRHDLIPDSAQPVVRLVYSRVFTPPSGYAALLRASNQTSGAVRLDILYRYGWD